MSGATISVVAGFAPREVRVWVDGKQVIDRWHVHEFIVDEAPITGGRHALGVEYFEHVSGAELRVEIVKP